MTDTAFGLGYESLSGFNDGVQSVFGSSPRSIDQKRVINIIRFTTEIGPMFACASEDGLCLLEFTDRRMLETEFQDLCKRLDAVILPGANKHLDKIQVQLDEYY